MATIRSSIYVGLGGTGILAISKTKKMYEDAYGKGNIPEQIAFAAIDFDLTEVNNKILATDMRDDFLNFKMAGSPKQLYSVRKEQGEYAWMPKTNTRFIGDRVVDGASQVRTYGRFLTEMIKDNIARRIADCITQVTNIESGFEHNIAENQPIDIHIVMSLAGGTGCGAFLNVAQLIRDKYQNRVKIIGYGVIHSIFRTMDPSTNKSPRVVANAYSAILDLDYLMGASDDNPIKVSLNGATKELKSPIYDVFFVIDNETENGKHVDSIQKLCEVVGTTLYAAGGDMGEKFNKVLNNINWTDGNANISPKLGWVYSLGACQIVYKGDLLADIYGLKAAIEVIRKLQNRSSDIQQAATNWTEEAGIREDGDKYNQMIDSIYDPKKITATKMPVLDIKDSITEIKAAVNKYINTLVEFPAENDITNKSAEITGKLKEKVASLLNAENGVGNSLSFLTSLKEILSGYKSEMESESSVLEKKYSDKQSVLDSKNYKEYEDYSKKLFSGKSGKEERLTELIARHAQQIVKDKLEAERRKKAYNIFTAILAEVAVLNDHIQDIDKKLTNLLNDYENEKVTKQNHSESSLVFEYDLSYNERLTLELNSRDVVISDYIASLGKSLYDVDLKKDLDETIKNFVTTLKKANEYRNKLIVDVIKDLNEEEYKRLKKEITEKSSRLLRLDDRGQVNKTRGNTLATSKMMQNYLISTYENKDKERNKIKIRFEEDDSFMRDISKEFVYSDVESMKQKIICSRLDGSIIPYCIGAFDDITVDREYNVLIQDALSEGSTTFNPHFDKNLFEEMKLKDFKLKPEMQNEAELYWILGSLFGWQTVKEQQYIMEKDSNGNPLKIEHKEEVENTKYIRVNKGKYEFWNEDGESIGMLGKWTPLNKATQRDQAFQFFKTCALPSIKNMLYAKIKSDIRNKGLVYYETIVDGIIANGKFDYIDKIICADKNSSTYYSQAKDEGKCFDEEWNYIEKHLKNALSNFKS